MKHLTGVAAVLVLAALGAASALGGPYFLEHTYLNPTPEDYDYFGDCVAGVGGNALVGAPYDNTGASAAGAAYLFDGTTGALRLTLLNPTPAALDSFGRSVAGLGANLLVGAPFDDPGAVSNAGSAYLFHGTTGALLQTFVKPIPGVNEHLGWSVAALGMNALVGVTGEAGGGAVYLFDPSDGSVVRTFPNPAPTANDGFGSSVAALGANVLVGAPGNDTGATNAGAAYLLNGLTGALLQTFLNPTPASGEEFGNSVALVGGNVIVGARYDNGGAGAAYVFDATTGALLRTLLTPTPGGNASFGYSIAAVGTNVLIGEPGNDTGAANAGAAFLFDPNTGTLIDSFFSLTPADSGSLGSSVAGVGNKVLLGAPFADSGTGFALLFSAVPEPATLTLLALGGVGMLTRRRRSRAGRRVA